MIGDPQADGIVIGEGLVARLPKIAHRGRRAEDTAAGCRTLAAASLASAALAALPNGRGRFEHSAAVWAQRADLLTRLEAGHAARVLAASGRRDL
jgi:hypothetical protein